MVAGIMGRENRKGWRCLEISGNEFAELLL